ncbi:MAG: ATP-binding protein [Gemmatimonadota bacterium]
MGPGPSEESEERFRTLVELAPDSIVVHRDLRILYINPAGAALLGAPSPDTLIGRNLLEFTHPDYHGSVKDRMGQLSAPGAAVPLVRQRLRRLDGNDVDIEVASAACTYSHQLAVVTIARDITERRHLEEALRQAQKMEAVGELTSGIAHDFKNILSIILSTAEYLGEVIPAHDAEARAGIADLQSAARRGAEMIRRLMAFSRRAELRLVPLQLGEVVQDGGTLMRRILPESIDIRLDVEPDAGVVQADAAAVEQILLNLATNARDAMPHGGTLTLSVHGVRLDAPLPTATGPIGPGAFVCAVVSDTGTGMDERTRARIFEPFFTTKEVGKGTGLGMSMVQGLVTQLGGAIAVESELGKGTTMRLFFPMLAERVARKSIFTGDLVAARAPQPVPKGTEQVLLVEDEDGLRRASKRGLERLGYTVHAAADGEEGLQLLRAHAGQIALVISDTLMPRMDGFALYRAVTREWPGVRFMFASGYPVAELAGAGEIPINVPFIAKPWAFQDFARIVRQVLDSPIEE